jgi:septum formation protein
VTIREVTFANLSAGEINYYVDKYQPYDKAGAYGVQEWIGYVGIVRLEGSYFNVMGLPVHKVYEVLKHF